MSKKNVISVWPDTTTEPGVISWIVSRDELAADETSETSFTVKYFDDDQRAAIEFGTELARKERKPLMTSNLAGDYSIDEAP